MDNYQTEAIHIGKIKLKPTEYLTSVIKWSKRQKEEKHLTSQNR